ncbi:MAG TPA: hypothetical protein PK339_12675 [Flavitalea sp.]|nr:hypothetical protein [Flavitalea sp.]
MDSVDLKRIIEKITEFEGLDIKSIALKASVGRSYLSTTINSTDPINLNKSRMVRKLAAAFPGYFKKNTKEHESGDTSLKDDLIDSQRNLIELQKSEIARLKENLKELDELRAIVEEYHKGISSSETSASSEEKKSNPYSRTVEQLSKGLNPEYKKAGQNQPGRPSNTTSGRKSGKEE